MGSRVHAGFISCFVFAVMAFLGALVASIASSDVCNPPNPPADCGAEVSALQSTANVIALTGLGFILAGVGFQVGLGAGRRIPNVPPMPNPAMVAPAGPPQYPGTGGLPAQPQGPPPQPGPGQWGG